MNQRATRSVGRSSLVESALSVETLETPARRSALPARQRFLERGADPVVVTLGLRLGGIGPGADGWRPAAGEGVRLRGHELLVELAAPAAGTPAGTRAGAGERPGGAPSSVPE